jgi:hypothetical protein
MIVSQHDARRILQKYYGSAFKFRLTTREQIGVRPVFDQGITLAWKKLDTGRASAVRIGQVRDMRVGCPVVIDWNWSDVSNDRESLAYFIRHVETQRWYTFKSPHGPHTDVEHAQQWPTPERAAEVASQLTRSAGRGVYEAATMTRYRLHEGTGCSETWCSVELYAASFSEIKQAVIAGFRCGTARWATVLSAVVFKLDATGQATGVCP